MLVKSLTTVRSSSDYLAGGERAGESGPTLGEIISAKIQKGDVHLPIRKLPPNVQLYSGGDYGDWLYLISNGWVKNMTWSRGGKPCLLDINGPLAILGISGFLTSRRAETAMTKTMTEIGVIARDQFHQMTCDPVFHAAWRDHLAASIVEQQEVLTHFVTLDSEDRLAMALLRLRRK
jgi:CRP/FNR family cyclic AMP-dependent transcriptional regulator